jgi:hypothetical protein
MAAVRKLRKWHFLLLGAGLILISAFLWYWDWRSLGIPSPLRAEHFITLVTFVVGFIVLGIFVVRLNRRQVLIMLIFMVIVNLIAALASLWINRTWPAFFELLRHPTIDAYDPRYIDLWHVYFLRPALIALHAGFLLLWIETLIMFLVRKPTDNPE